MNGGYIVNFFVRQPGKSVIWQAGKRAAVWICLSIFISACSQESEMLFLNPPEGSRSAFSVQQQKALSLDILFVVGSSQDGHSHADLLTGHIGYFLKQLLSKKIIDLHIGFTVASSSQNIIDSIGDLHFLTSEDYDENEFYGGFQRILEVVSSTGRQENVSFFDAVSRVLTDGDGFYRDKAHLLIVFVGGDDRSQTDINSLTQKLLESKANQKDHITVLSIYPSSECSLIDLDVDRIEEMTEQFGGAVVHLCRPESTQLDEIAQIIYPRFAFIPLTRVPLLKTVTLCYGSDMISQDSWSYAPQSHRIILDWEIDFLETADHLPDNDLSIYMKKASCEQDKSPPPLLDLTYISVNPSTIVKNALSLEPQTSSE